MDRIQVCGTCDAGSIPAEGTNRKYAERRIFIFAREKANCLAFVQESNRGRESFSIEESALVAESVLAVPAEGLFNDYAPRDYPIAYALDLHRIL